MMIATRILKSSGTNPGSNIDIPVRIFAPEEGDKDWSCRYEIDWPEGMETKRLWGVDSVQALVLALQMIGADLYSSSYHKAGQLMFDAPGGGYGFPVPTSVRDQLVGYDKLYGA